jgi:exopolysaccharide biosynthesis polyprenyl glycosylphosphotransferase
MSIKTRQIFLFLGDIIFLYFSLFLALFFGFFKNFSWQIFFDHLLPFSILYFFWLIIFYIFGLYDLHLIKTSFNFYSRLSLALLFSLFLAITFFYLIPFFGISPKTNLLLNVLIFGTLFFGWRKIFYFLFSKYFLKRVAILGENSLAKEIAKEIAEKPNLGYKLVKFFNENSDLSSEIKKEKIDTLILAKNLEKDSKLTENLYQCLSSKVEFLDLAKASEILAEKIPLSFLNQIWFLENLKEKEKELYEKIKEILDKILAFLILLLSLPFWLPIAFFIKIEDRGPIFYLQERVGKNKKTFFLIKFRSMKKEAEKESGAIWAKKEDPRVTKVGKFLRRFYLDELPQMLNILKGDLSLVGPRPERPEFVKKLEKEIPHYNLRHLIKPGFTGWAQLKFRYSRSIEDSLEKFQYDLYYLKNRSLFLDLGILLKTFQLLFKKE